MEFQSTLHHVWGCYVLRIMVEYFGKFLSHILKKQIFCQQYKSKFKKKIKGNQKKSYYSLLNVKLQKKKEWITDWNYSLIKFILYNLWVRMRVPVCIFKQLLLYFQAVCSRTVGLTRIKVEINESFSKFLVKVLAKERSRDSKWNSRVDPVTIIILGIRKLPKTAGELCSSWSNTSSWM